PTASGDALSRRASVASARPRAADPSTSMYRLSQAASARRSASMIADDDTQSSGSARGHQHAAGGYADPTARIGRRDTGGAIVKTTRHDGDALGGFPDRGRTNDAAV